MTGQRAVTVVAVLVLSVARAHPDYIDTSLCGEAAHPDGPHKGHGAPVLDRDLSLRFFWATPDNSVALDDATEYPAYDEWVAQNGHLELPPGAFAPGERLVALLACGGGRTCQVLMTATAGAFEDRGINNDGDAQQDAAVRCSGRRVDVRGANLAYHPLVWTAPAAGSGPVAFGVTAAASQSSSYLRLTPSHVVAANASLARPGGAPAGPPAPREKRMALVLVLHGWFAALAFAVAFPLAAALAWATRPLRRGRSATAAQPEPSHAPVGALAGLASKRVSAHKRLAYTGAVLAAVAFVLVFAYNSAPGLDHFWDSHSHWGIAALILAANQVQGGLLRPPNAGAGERPSSERLRWRAVHGIAGLLTLTAGVVATWKGLNDAAHEGAVAGALLARIVTTVWLCILIMAVLAGEVRRRFATEAVLETGAAAEK